MLPRNGYCQARVSFRRVDHRQDTAHYLLIILWCFSSLRHWFLSIIACRRIFMRVIGLTFRRAAITVRQQLMIIAYRVIGARFWLVSILTLYRRLNTREGCRIGARRAGLIFSRYTTLPFRRRFITCYFSLLSLRHYGRAYRLAADLYAASCTLYWHIDNAGSYTRRHGWVEIIS